MHNVDLLDIKNEYGGIVKYPDPFLEQKNTEMIKTNLELLFL